MQSKTTRKTLPKPTPGTKHARAGAHLSSTLDSVNPSPYASPTQKLYKSILSGSLPTTRAFRPCSYRNYWIWQKTAPPIQIWRKLFGFIGTCSGIKIDFTLVKLNTPNPPSPSGRNRIYLLTLSPKFHRLPKALHQYPKKYPNPTTFPFYPAPRRSRLNKSYLEHQPIGSGVAHLSGAVSDSLIVNTTSVSFLHLCKRFLPSRKDGSFFCSLTKPEMSPRYGSFRRSSILRALKLQVCFSRGHSKT